MEQSVEIMAGIGFLILGVSILLRPASWAEWVAGIGRRGHSAILTLGGVNILLGPFILAFHWVWSGVAMVLTIVGILLTFRGFLCLLFPDFVKSMIERMTPHLTPLLRFGGLVTMLIGLAALYPVWQGV